MITMANVTPILRGALLGAFVTVLVPVAAPHPVAAQSGAGTEYFKCRDRAWADYNSCLMNDPNSLLNQVKCFLAWDLDNVSCNTKLIKDLIFE